MTLFYPSAPRTSGFRLWHFLFGLLFLLAPAAWAQAPNWHTAIPIDTAYGGNVGGGYLATDPSGNVYVAGSFYGTANFGITTLTSAGSYDVYVAKWSPLTKSYVWVQRAGGPGDDFASAITVTSSGIYLAGGFSSRITSGPITATFGTTTLTNPRGNTADGFVAKMTDTGSAGTFVWAQRLGGTGDDAVSALAVSGGNVYAAGFFTSTPATFGNTSLNSTGGQDIFLTKVVDAGATSSFGWTQQLGGSFDDLATAVSAVGSAVYVAGNFSSPTLACGSTTLTNALSANSSDIFVTKLVDAGATSSFTWAQRAGSIGEETLTAMAVNGSSIYLGGNYYGNTLPMGTTTLPNAGAYDFFVAKLTDAGATGSFTWAQRAGSYGNELLFSLGAVGNNIYITGKYASHPVTIGATTLTNVSTITGYSDIFVARLTDAGPTGSFAWAQRAGGWGIDEVESLAIGAGGQVYIAGYANVPCTFGSLALLNQRGAVTYQAYLAALTDGAALASKSSLAQAHLVLYPNPAHASAVVQLPAQAGVSQATLTLRDALGRVARTTQVPLPATGLSQEINLAGLSTGVYVLHVQAGETTAVSRLTIE